MIARAKNNLNFTKQVKTRLDSKNQALSGVGLLKNLWSQKNKGSQKLCFYVYSNNLKKS